MRKVQDLTYLTFDYIKNYTDMDWMESFEPTP